MARIGGGVGAALLMLSACGSEATDSSPRASSPAVTTPVSSNASTVTTEPDSVPVVGVYDGVVAYPACGNEPFEHDGVVWYPLFDEGFEPPDDALVERAEEVRAAARDAAPVPSTHGLVRVVAPGPGDDVGTLVIWSDGVARWTSDSGDLDVWLVDDQLTYNWVC